MSSSTSSRTRGPYKQYLTDPEYPVPRQTRYNWRCAAESDDFDSDDDLTTQNPLESQTPNSGCDESHQTEDDVESVTEDDADPTESANEDDANQIESAGGMLLTRSKATKGTATMERAARILHLCYIQGQS